MKRLLILIVLILTLSGCTAKRGTIVIINKNPITAKVDWNNQAIECDILKQNKEFVFTVTSPQQLEGIKIICKEDQSIITYLGLDCAVENDFSPYSFAVKIAEVLQECDGQSAQDYKLCGNKDGLEWEMLINKQGNPTKICCAFSENVIKEQP